MGEATRDTHSICVFCKKTITRGQRPAVLLQPGKQAHVECWIKHQQEANKPN